MARSVGSIEVTVDADTGKLKAQLVKGGQAAGAGAKAAIEKELRGIEAEMGLQTAKARAELRNLKRAIDSVDAEITVGIDEAALRADLAEIETQLETLSHLRSFEVDVKLRKDAEARIRARIEALQAQRNQLLLDLEIAPRAQAALEAELALITAQDHTVTLLAELDQREIDKAVAEMRARRFEARVTAQLEAENLVRDWEARKQALERSKVKIPFAGDFTEVNEQIRTFGVKAESSSLQLRAELQTALLDAAADAEKERLEEELQLDAIDVELRTALAAAEAEALAAQIDQLIASIEVTADTDPAKLEIELLRIEELADELGLDVTAELAQFRAQMAAIRAKEQANAIEVPVDTKGADAAGIAWGDAFAGGAHRGLSTRMKAIVAGVVVLMEPAAVAIEALLAGSIEVLGSAFQALGGAAGAALPTFLALGGAATAFVVGSAGMIDAIKAINEGFAEATANGVPFTIFTEDIGKALANLAPSAAAAAIEFARMRPALADVQSSIQQTLFEDLDRTIHDFATFTLPELSSALDTSADSLNRFFKELGTTLVQVDFGDLFADIQPAVDDVLDGVISVVAAIEPFFKAATPAAKLLAENFAQTAESLLDMVNAGANSGGLADFLEAGVDSLSVWWDLIRNVGDALFTLFQSGAAGGDTLITRLANVVEMFDDWMESVEGQNTLEEFFKTGGDVLASFVPVLKGLQGFFDNLVTPGAVARLDEFFEGIGDLLPMLGTVFELFGRTQLLTNFVDLLVMMGEALVPAVPAFQELAEAINTAFADAIVLIAPHMPRLADALAQIALALVPAVGEAGQLLAGAFLAMLPAVELLADIFEALPSSITGMALAFVALNKVLPFSVTGVFNLTQNLLGLSGVAGGLVTGGLLAGLTVLAFKTAEGFAEDAERANEAKVAIEGLADAIEQLPELGPKVVETEVWSHLMEQGEGVRVAFRKLLDVDISTWARGLTTGTTNAASAIADLLDSTGPTGKVLADMFKQGKISAEDLIQLLGPGGEASTTIGKFHQDLREELEAQDISYSDLQKAIKFATEESERYNAAEQEVINTTAGGIEVLGAYGEAQLAVNQGHNASAEAAARAEQEFRNLNAGIEPTVSQMIDFRDEAELIQNLETARLADFAEGFLDIATNAQDAKDKADALKTALELLGGGQLDFEASVDQVISGFADIEGQIDKQQELVDKALEAEAKARAKPGDAAAAKAARDARKEAEEFTLTLEGQSEAAVENRELFRDQVGTIEDFIVAGVAAGKSSEEIAAGVEMMNAVLVANRMRFGESEAEAKAWLEQMSVEPDQLRVLLNDEELVQAIIDGATWEEAVARMNQTTISPEVDTSHLDEVLGTTQELRDSLLFIDSMPDSTVSVNIPELDTIVAQVGNLRLELDKISGKVVEATVIIGGRGRFEAAGGVSPEGFTNIAGEAGPEWMVRQGRRTLLNEPTIVPPHSIIQPIQSHELSSLVGNGNIEKQVNNYLTITPPSADPGAVATQIINRAAVLANR